MTNEGIFLTNKFKTSAELDEMRCANVKRNSFVTSVGFLTLALLAGVFGYDLFLAIFVMALSLTLLTISLKTNVSNFKVQERIVFILSTFVIIGLLFASNIITTVVVFLPCLAYMFFVESNKLVRFGTAALMVAALLVSSIWFFPDLAVGSSAYDLRFEALFDVLAGAIFTGFFVRFHMEFMRLSVHSAKIQAGNHEKYKQASSIAYDSLASQKGELDSMYEASRVALMNERLAHAQIAASQDQLEQFAYAASHDLKEPIRTIRSFLQVVRRRLPAEIVEQDGLAEHFEFVEQSSDSMHQLLERLLVYSRIDKASLSKKSVGLIGVLQRLCSTPELGLNKLGVEVSVKLPDELSEVEVFMHSEHATDIFKELFNNAILFRSEDRTLKVGIEVDIVNAESIMITFSDNGIGIQEEYHEQVFGLFSRLNTREDYPGSGLGLSLVRAIVVAAGGQVSLTSEFGKGTDVHVILPTKAVVEEVPAEL
ncbi:MAG: ATP-binding protein [Saprospiraceae bacterium]